LLARHFQKERAPALLVVPRKKPPKSSPKRRRSIASQFPASLSAANCFLIGRLQLAPAEYRRDQDGRENEEGIAYCPCSLQSAAGTRSWHSRGAHFGGLLPLHNCNNHSGEENKKKEVEDEENDDNDGAALASNERPITLINGKGEGKGFWEDGEMPRIFYFPMGARRGQEIVQLGNQQQQQRQQNWPAELAISFQY
jgi:hypothetical protein